MFGTSASGAREQRGPRSRSARPGHRGRAAAPRTGSRTGSPGCPAARTAFTGPAASGAARAKTNKPSQK